MDLTKLHLHWGESSYQGKTYRTYSLARAYREGEKNRKEIVVKLGKLTDVEAKHWRDILQMSRRPDSFWTTLDDIVVRQHFTYLDAAVVNAVWDEWKLDDAFDDTGRRDVDVSIIARILTINRCLDPMAKSRTPEWFSRTALPWMLDVSPDLVNPSRIFRELESIEARKEAICSHLYEKMLKESPESMRSVFYDLSTSTFSGSHCVLMKWGHCKEGYRNHVVLALVVNGDGLPFYWEVLPGGTADATTISWLMEHVRNRLAVSNITLVFDRGMVSEDNLALLEKDGVKYITAMDKSQMENISGIDFQHFASHDEEPAEELLSFFTKINDNTYYKEVPGVEKRRYILCFNPQLFRDQRRARRQAIAGFRDFLETMNRELLAAKHSRQHKATYAKFRRQLIKNRLNGFMDVNLTSVHSKISDKPEDFVNTYQATESIDDDKLKNAGRLDGFWLLATNRVEKDENGFQLSPPDAIKPYREKVVIESAFRDIKSFVEIAPLYVWTKEHVRAHFTICVLAYLIDRTLTLRLHKKQGQATRDVVTHEKLYSVLSECHVDHILVKNAGISTCNMTEPTGAHKELLDRVGLIKTLQPQVVDKMRAALSG